MLSLGSVGVSVVSPELLLAVVVSRAFLNPPSSYQTWTYHFRFKQSNPLRKNGPMFSERSLFS